MSGLRLFLTLAFVLAATAAFARGPGEHGHDDSTAFGEPGNASAPTRIIAISMREADGKMLFAPDVVSVMKGEQIRFRLRNQGELEHEFVIGTADEIGEHAEMMKANPHMKHNDPNGWRLQPKASADIVWKFTKAGTFEFVCLIPGHHEAGMHGIVVVK